MTIFIRVEQLTNSLSISLLGVIFVFLSLSESFSSPPNKFNQLILAKSSLEYKFGVRSVECFPFKEDIGFTEAQIQLIEQCYTGVQLFASALDKIAKVEIFSVGISTRFLRTGGFNTILIPWNASLEEVISFLKEKISKENQKLFLGEISTLKHKINGKFRILSLYCSQEISNEQCMSGYSRLASIETNLNPRPILWQEIILDNRQGLGKDSYSFRIKYNASPKEMLKALQQDPQKVWLPRKKMYENINSKNKQGFVKRLQVATYFCSTELTEKKCLDGVETLNEISKNQDMRMKPWGEVSIEKYNTFIKDDFDVSFRFDLPLDKFVKYFLSKENRVKATDNAVLAEKLEKRTLNNSSGLRAVCDLEGMHSKLCVKAFKNFIIFVSGKREYRVKSPWTNVMFVDGTKLTRVNFALNSSARHSYIYIDAGSELEEFRSHLMKFEN
jgi:hypothetical protein